MEMILLDTNILIEILKGDEATVETVENFTLKTAISSISVMELYCRALNKTELLKLEQFVSLFEILHLDEAISTQAVKLVKTYAKSHRLDIPDCIIASTALVHRCPLFTYNLKDFRYIQDLNLV